MVYKELDLCRSKTIITRDSYIEVNAIQLDCKKYNKSAATLTVTREIPKITLLRPHRQLKEDAKNTTYPERNLCFIKLHQSYIARYILSIIE